MVDAEPKPMYEEKMRVSPWDLTPYFMAIKQYYLIPIFKALNTVNTVTVMTLFLLY